MLLHNALSHYFADLELGHRGEKPHLQSSSVLLSKLEAMQPMQRLHQLRSLRSWNKEFVEYKRKQASPRPGVSCPLGMQI